MRKIITLIMIFVFCSLGTLLPAQTIEPTQMRSLQEMQAEIARQPTPIVVSPVAVHMPSNAFINICLLVIALFSLGRFAIVIYDCYKDKERRIKDDKTLAASLERRERFEKSVNEKLDTLISLTIGPDEKEAA